MALAVDAEVAQEGLIPAGCGDHGVDIQREVSAFENGRQEGHAAA